MDNLLEAATRRDGGSIRRKLSRDTVYLIGDLLPLCDFAGVLLAAYLAMLAYSVWFGPAAAPSFLWDDASRAALAAAVLAPLILCDRAFVSFASDGQTKALLRCYAVRFVMFAGVAVMLGLASSSLSSLSTQWLGLWLASTLLVTALTRVVLVRGLRRFERNGLLAETVAIVGAGAVADGLIQHLASTRRGSVEIVGVYDDRRMDDCANPPSGSIADLVTLGKTQALDWILLAAPAANDAALRRTVHRLKSLSVPIGLCPPDADFGVAARSSRSVGDALSLTRPPPAVASARAAAELVVPRWLLTLFSLPTLALHAIARRLRSAAAPRTTAPRLRCALDDYDLDGFAAVAARYGHDRFGYVVTPNADHLIRLHREPSFRELYADAAYVLLDSRFIARLLRMTQKRTLPVCTGSDLTAKLFAEVIRPDDALVLIGGSAEQAAQLTLRYSLTHLEHFNPPMGFIRNPQAVEQCLRFVEAHSPFRYCFLAVGVPQQEALAQRLKARGLARGLALCIGASINFLTGEEQRAPVWMQRAGVEWLYRLLQAPGRMAHRYLVRGPELFGLLRRTDIVLRRAVALPTPAVAIEQAPAPAPTAPALVPALLANRSTAAPVAAARRRKRALRAAPRTVDKPARVRRAPPGAPSTGKASAARPDDSP